MRGMRLADERRLNPRSRRSPRDRSGYPSAVPSLPAVHRARRRPLRIVVLGHLMLDLVIESEQPAGRPPARTCPVGSRCARAAPPRTRPGGSRGWAPGPALITAVGRDAAGPGLLDDPPARRSRPRSSVAAGSRPSARAGSPSCESPRRALLRGRPRRGRRPSHPPDLHAGWFAAADLLHLPVYSLLAEPLGSAGRRAVEMARSAKAAR